MRTLLAHLQALSAQETLQLRSAVVRASTSRSLVPLFSDQTTATSTIASMDTVISCDTTLRRFAAGSRVVIYNDQSDPLVNTFDVREIDSLNSSSITLTAGVTNAYLSGALIFPLIEAKIIFRQQGQILTDHTTDLLLDVIEVVGDTQLPVTTTIGTSPSGVYEHDSIPLLEANEDFNRSISWSVNRDGGFIQSGIGSIPQPYGSRGRIALTLPVTATTRQAAWDVVNFFDSRGGRLHPFWLMLPTNDLSPLRLVDAAGSGIVVTAVGPERDWDDRPYIGIIADDGTRMIRTISSVSRSAGEDTLTFDTNLDTEWGTPDINAMDRFSLAYKCRFDSDELVEQWKNDQVMTTTLKVIELLEEKAVTVTDLAKISTVALQINFTAGECSGVDVFENILAFEDFADYADGALVPVSQARLDTGESEGKWVVFKEGPLAHGWGVWEIADEPNLIISNGKMLLDPSHSSVNFVFYYVAWSPSTNIDKTQPYEIEMVYGLPREFLNQIPPNNYFNESSFTIYLTQPALDGSFTWDTIRADHGNLWDSLTSYSLNTVVYPATDTRDLTHKCTQAGISAENEPTWPTVAGQTVVDGTVIWTAQTNIDSIFPQSRVMLETVITSNPDGPSFHLFKHGTRQSSSPNIWSVDQDVPGLLPREFTLTIAVDSSQEAIVTVDAVTHPVTLSILPTAKNNVGFIFFALGNPTLTAVDIADTYIKSFKIIGEPLP